MLEEVYSHKLNGSHFIVKHRGTLNIDLLWHFTQQTHNPFSIGLRQADSLSTLGKHFILGNFWTRLVSPS